MGHRQPVSPTTNDQSPTPAPSQQPPDSAQLTVIDRVYYYITTRNRCGEGVGASRTGPGVLRVSAHFVCPRPRPWVPVHGSNRGLKASGGTMKSGRVILMVMLLAATAASAQNAGNGRGWGWGRGRNGQVNNGGG